jgi:hypothetical protein
MLAVAATLACWAAELGAQVPGIDLTVTPRVGAYRPGGDLAESAGSRARLGRATAFGASVELRLPILPAALRANIDYVPSLTGTVNGAEVADDNKLLLLSGDLVFHLLPAISPVQPYVLAGAGTKKYDFDNAYATAVFSFPDDSDLAAHLGAGVGLKLGPIGALVEVTDYLSRFQLAGGGDRKIQNDVLVMAGLRIGLF